MAESKHTPSLAERSADRIGYALAAYPTARGSRLPDKTDFLTDLLHYADLNGDDCEQLVRDALANWKAER